MVVAVAGVSVMEMSGDEVIRVVPVRHGFVAAGWAVRVAGGVGGALVIGRAGVRIGGRDGESVFVRVSAMRVVQMAVMQIVSVPVVENGDMAARGTVGVRLGVLPVRGAAGGDERGEQDEGRFQQGRIHSVVHAAKDTSARRLLLKHCICK